MSDPNSRIATCSWSMLANTYPLNWNTYIQTLSWTIWEPDSVLWSHSWTICWYECLDTHTWSWTTNTCLQKINWVCWSANWQNLTIQPSSWLCAWWDLSGLSWIWPSTWTCNWKNWWNNSPLCSTTRYCMAWWMTPCMSR